MMKKIQNYLVVALVFLLAACSGGNSSNNQITPSPTPSPTLAPNLTNLGELPNGSIVYSSSATFNLNESGDATTGVIGISGGNSGYTYTINFNIISTNNSALLLKKSLANNLSLPVIMTTPSPCIVKSGTSEQTCVLSISAVSADIGNYTLEITASGSDGNTIKLSSIPLIVSSNNQKESGSLVISLSKSGLSLPNESLVANIILTNSSGIESFNTNLLQYPANNLINFSQNNCELSSEYPLCSVIITPSGVESGSVAIKVVSTDLAYSATSPELAVNSLFSYGQLVFSPANFYFLNNQIESIKLYLVNSNGVSDLNVNLEHTNGITLNKYNCVLSSQNSTCSIDVTANTESLGTKSIKASARNYSDSLATINLVKPEIYRAFDNRTVYYGESQFIRGAANLSPDGYFTSQIIFSESGNIYVITTGNVWLESNNSWINFGHFIDQNGNLVGLSATMYNDILYVSAESMIYSKAANSTDNWQPLPSLGLNNLVSINQLDFDNESLVVVANVSSGMPWYSTYKIMSYNAGTWSEIGDISQVESKQINSLTVGHQGVYVASSNTVWFESVGVWANFGNLNLLESHNIRSLMASESVIYVGLDNGSVWRAFESSESWSNFGNLESLESYSINGLVANGNSIYAQAQSTKIWRNNGTSWSGFGTLESYERYPLSGFASYSSDIYTGSYTGGIWKQNISNNGWQPLLTGSLDNINYIIDQNNMLYLNGALYIGLSNKIWFESDNVSWESLDIGSPDILISVLGSDMNNNIYVGGYNGNVYIESNHQLVNLGNLAMIQQSTTGESRQIGSILITSNNIYAGSNNGYIWKSINESWSSLGRLSQNTYNVNRIIITNNGDLYSVADSGLWVYKPNDGTWFNIISSNNIKASTYNNNLIYVGLSESGYVMAASATSAPYNVGNLELLDSSSITSLSAVGDNIYAIKKSGKIWLYFNGVWQNIGYSIPSYVYSSAMYVVAQ